MTLSWKALGCKWLVFGLCLYVHTHKHTHLCEHGLSILGDHGTLITVKGDKVIVEGLLWVFQYIVELSRPALKYTPEVPRNQRPANCWKGGETTRDE